MAEADANANEAANLAADNASDGSADDSLFKEFSGLKDQGLPVTPDPLDQQIGDGGKAADQNADGGAAQAAPEKNTPAEGKTKAEEQADDPKALKAALEAAQADVDKLNREFHAYKSQEGRRQAALSGKNVPGVDVPKTPAANAAAEKAAAQQDEEDPLTSPEFLKVKEEYGDVVAPLEKVIRHLKTKLDTVEGRTATAERDLSGLTAEKANTFFAEETAKMTQKHKDWQTIVASDDFSKWLDDQPEEVRGLVLKNAERIVDAKAGIRAIDFYKSDRGIGREPAPAKDDKVPGKGQSATAPANKDSRRNRQLESAAAVPDRGPGPAGGPSGDDEAALFRHYAAQKDKEMAAGRL